VSSNLVETADNFLRLKEMRKELEAALKDTKRDLLAAESELYDSFDESGVDSIRINGHTVYKRREYWPLAIDREAAVVALREHGYGDFVSESPKVQSLRSLVKEWLADDRDVTPEWFDEVFDVQVRLKIGARR